LVVVTSLLALVVAGSLVYCLLVVYSTRHYLQSRIDSAWPDHPVSVLKPLSGLEAGLEENLRTFFTQQYPEFELLFAVRAAADPACEVVARLRREFPGVDARLLFVGEPPYANAKVWSLEQMTAAARHDILIMSDSDIRATPDMLRAIAAEFQDSAVGVTTCPYRAVAGASFWSRLEAIGMNTEFLAGVVVARVVEGMKFALGPTLSARRQVIAGVGGWKYLSEFLAEDFVLGNLATENGWKVLLSRCIVEHHIGSAPFKANARHRLRWFRSTRRSRPVGYAGQLFTNPIPLALLTIAVWPAWWQILPVTLVFRAAAAYATAGSILHGRLNAGFWLLLPLQDLLSFAFWISGFFGNTIVWRGEKYRVLADGRFRPVSRY
jgi:ceramide glucosyltransferase